MSNKNIEYVAKLHWIIFLWPVLLLIASIYLALSIESVFKPSMIIAFVACCWFFMVWMTYQFSSLTIKKSQVILRTGFFVRNTIDIPLNKIESIDIRQSLLGSICKYGCLVITGTGGTRQLINYITKPLTCRRHIEQLMHH